MEPIHPGIVLKDAFEELGMSKTQFAKNIGITRQMLDLVFKGQRPIRAPIAAAIAIALDTSAKMWLNMQNKYDLYQYRLEHQADLKAIKKVA